MKVVAFVRREFEKNGRVRMAFGADHAKHYSTLEDNLEGQPSSPFGTIKGDGRAP